MVDCDEIVATHGHLVWRTAYRLLGRHDDALDCCQEAFSRAYRAASLRVGRRLAFLPGEPGHTAGD